MRHDAGMALPIEDYALIGDRHTAALVGRNGSIDWLCLPRFDSPACFAGAARDRRPRPLAARAGRRLHLDPAVRRRLDRLETTFTTATGVVTLLDLMPTGDDRADVVRRITGVEGTVRMRHEWVVRLDYGHVRPVGHPPADRPATRSSRAVAGPDQLVLRGPRLPRAAMAPPRRRVRRRGRRRADVLDDLGPVVGPTARARPDAQAHQGDRQGRAGLARELRPDGGSSSRRGRPVAADAAAAHPRAHRRDRRGARPPRCPRTSAASATGTTATAGCATPPSPWSR